MAKLVSPLQHVEIPSHQSASALFRSQIPWVGFFFVCGTSLETGVLGTRQLHMLLRCNAERFSRVVRVCSNSACH